MEWTVENNNEKPWVCLRINHLQDHDIELEIKALERILFP